MSTDELRAAAVALINELDKIARDTDQHEYGLPIYGTGDSDKLLAAVLAAFGRVAGRPADDTTPAPGCDLCGSTGPLHLSGRCHPTAPLRAELAGGVLTLRCYVPECGREVGRFAVGEAAADDGEPVTADWLAGLGFTPAPHHRNRYRDVRTEFAVERIGMADGVSLRVWSQARTGLTATPPAPSSAFGVFALVEDSFSAVTLPGTYPTRGHVRALLRALGAAHV